MDEAAAKIYVNLLKKAYSVKSGEKVFAITDTSCYSVTEEMQWLANNMPESGGRSEYFRSLSGLGLNEPEKIFNKLMAIGAFQEKPARSWKTVFRSVLSPKVRLLPAQWQERVLGFAGVETGGLGRMLSFFFWPALLGAILGLWLFAGGGDRMLPDAAFGKVNGLAVIVLVVISSLVHEVGHSFAAAASGIGLRPIGFSVYLIYPAFYTNVSGIDKLDLKKKILIDCGGFILQLVYILGLLLFASAAGSATAAEAVRWIMAMVLFNLNPFLRTDGYWLYKDTYSDLKHNRWMRAGHYLYLLAFMAFSVYFLRFIFIRIGSIWSELNILAHSPSYFFSGGYKVIIGAYFVFVGFSGGLRRFKEGRQEWLELIGVSAAKA